MGNRVIISYLHKIFHISGWPAHILARAAHLQNTVTSYMKQKCVNIHENSCHILFVAVKSLPLSVIISRGVTKSLL